jgi:hypothetical protein
LGVPFSRSVARFRHRRPSCHGCCWEDADVCDRENKHVAGNDFVCMDCQRNFNASKMPLVDRFIREKRFLGSFFGSWKR